MPVTGTVAMKIQNKPGKYEHSQYTFINFRPFKYFSTPKPIHNFPPKTTDFPCPPLNTDMVKFFLLSLYLFVQIYRIQIIL